MSQIVKESAEICWSCTGTNDAWSFTFFQLSCFLQLPPQEILQNTFKLLAKNSWRRLQASENEKKEKNRRNKKKKAQQRQKTVLAFALHQHENQILL